MDSTEHREEQPPSFAHAHDDVEYIHERLRSLRDALRAARQGDLAIRIPMDGGRDTVLEEVAFAFNALVDQHVALSRELDRVAHVVGVEGRMTERASLGPAGGWWTGAVDAVNSLIEHVAGPTFEVTRVLGAIAAGELSVTISARHDGQPLQGDFAQLGAALNSVVARLRGVTSAVSRVVREVGVEGKLGAQAAIDGLDGTWRGLVDDVNLLSTNLTQQVRNIAQVSTAIAHGDLSQKIMVEARGEISELKDTINVMVDQLRAFAAEVTRVAREVGTEGQLGGQAEVPGIAGTWKDLTDNVNVMASNLTNQVRGIVKVVTAVANGDLSQKFVLEAKGEIAALADTINHMTDTLRTFAEQVTTVAREVGTEGRLGGQAQVPGAAGTWRDLTDNVNVLAGKLTNQVRNIAAVTTAIAAGDLSQKITIDARGEILEVKNTINAMVDQLRMFAREVIRVAREVGTDGQLGGQAHVPGVAGTWKDLTDSVNLMASNLTDQVRGISKIVTAVANGDLVKRLPLVAKGEIAALAETINNMTETLRTFADQVTTVAREVGIEGKLGGQAKVPGAAGTWLDLTDNVNQLAAHLTTQVRAIFEVATAVIHGDLTRSIAVEARGEVQGLKDTINQMIANLRDTTRSNKEQDWLKTNLARFFAIMQGQRNLQSLTDLIMSELTPVVGAQHGAFYLAEREDERLVFKLTSTYAYERRKHLANRFELGESLVGQCALERKPIIVSEVPQDYVRIGSGLGEAPPRNLAVIPILFEDQVRGVLELASFHELTPVQLSFLEQLTWNIGLATNLIGASMRTEQLLQQLKSSNIELERRRKELEEHTQLLEVRNREIAQTSASLEAKSQDLARVSRYKSQFLTNMSHEVRTPLNSMMILAQMLAANEDHNLTAQQQDWAATIHSAGDDLLGLINQILDLSRVEAGKLETHLERHRIAEVRDLMERTFRPVALQNDLELGIEVGPRVPDSIVTDAPLLEQILKNLMSNAFKFTERGRVDLRIDVAPPGGSYGSAVLRKAPAVLAFAVTDTGIGISPERQEGIFEAFQQADMSIARKYGGTGLGLTISREYARVLGGEITLKSEPGAGSTFTLYVPLSDRDTAPPPAEPAAPPAEPTPPVATPEQLQSLSGKRVLVVEDDVKNLYAVTALLEHYGITVIAAVSAADAFTKLDQHADVDLVLMDIMLPEIDGYEATRRIRANKELAGIPIIALTAKATSADRDLALEAGCNGFVVKPVAAPELLAALIRNLRRK